MIRICTKCNRELDEEEIESPKKDEYENIICDSCFEKLYEYHCPLCENTFEEDFSKPISPQYFIITEEGEEDFLGDAGIYKILSYPFYADGMIEFHLFTSAIKKVADLPTEFDKNEFYNSMYYICDECTKKYMEKQ